MDKNQFVLIIDLTSLANISRGKFQFKNLNQNLFEKNSSIFLKNVMKKLELAEKERRYQYEYRNSFKRLNETKLAKKIASIILN